jgi:voltage-gated potassium channel
MEQIRVTLGVERAGKTLRDVQPRRELGVIVLAVGKADGKVLFNPAPETPIADGDYLIVIGEPTGLKSLERIVTGEA